MILAVDAGNTRVKVMLAGARSVRPVFAVDTEVLLHDDRAMRRRLEKNAPALARLEGAALCSVVPALDTRLERALGRATGKPVFTVRHTARFPFEVRVAAPRKLGADRLCAAAGAVEGRSSVIVVDIGSAITADLVARGAFVGGLIMVGPALALWALGRYARRLPTLPFDALEASSAPRFDDTRPSMTLGALTAARGAVLEAVRMLRRSSGGTPKVVVTGGGAAVLRPRLPRTWAYDPHLVGRGLYRVWAVRAAGGRPARPARQKRA